MAMKDGAAACAHHPERPATRTCDRCGDFVCDDCLVAIVDRQACGACRQIDGVDYLEAYRAAVWGKRDLFVWLVGIFGLVFFGLVEGRYLWLLMRDMATMSGPSQAKAVLFASNLLVLLGICLGYLLLWRPARLALLLSPLIGLLFLGGMVLVAGSWTAAPRIAAFYLICVVPLMLLHRSPRNRLAFKLPIDDEALRRLYDSEVNNRPARFSVFLAICGLALWPLLPLALVLGIIGLRRIDPSSWPPIGGRVPALIGVGLSSFGLLLWVALACVTLLA